MINPKQGLTSFTRVYQARSAPSARRVEAFGFLAASLAGANAVHESDAHTLAGIAQNFSITTIEEIASLALLDADDGTDFMQKLGVGAEMGDRMLGILRDTPDGESVLEELRRYGKFEYQLGCALDLANPPIDGDLLDPVTVAGVTFGAADGSTAVNALAGSNLGIVPPPPVSTGVNLIDGHMPPIKDQGNRGTCVAFTTVACLEYHISRFSGDQVPDLSEQFQFWNLIATTAQMTIASGFPILTRSGVCRETTWPYYPNPIAGDPSDAQGPPPSSAVSEAGGFRCQGVRQVSARSVAAIQNELRIGRLVGIAIPVYDSWFRNGTVRRHGNIIMPLPGEVPHNVGHAITLVGYADDPNFAGGGYFIVRNSWDHCWGTQSPLGSGYGTIPYLYIQRHNWDAWCIMA